MPSYVAPTETKGKIGDYAKSQVINVGGKPKIQCEEISMLLRKAKQAAEADLEVTVDMAVIAVPYHFNDSQRWDVQEAGFTAGFNEVHIIDDRIAAASAYCRSWKRDVANNVLVFHLDGGTLNVSIMTVVKGVFVVKSTAGNDKLGADNFDNFTEAYERAKTTLSASHQANFKIYYGGEEESITMSRERFEEINDFRSIMEPVEKALADAKMDKSQIHQIVLAGDSTRIQRIRQLLSQFFNGKELADSIDPDVVVILGASTYARILCSQHSFVWLGPPLYLSIEAATESIRRQRTIFIERFWTLGPCEPITVTHTFTTYYDNQPAVFIQVYNNQRVPLCKFVLTGTPPAPRGVPQIDMIFELDGEVLSVSAVNKSTGHKSQVTVAEVEGLLCEEGSAKKALESFCFDMKSIVEDEKLKNLLSEADTILVKCNEALEWLDANQQASREEFARKLKELDRETNLLPELSVRHCVGQKYEKTKAIGKNSCQ